MTRNSTSKPGWNRAETGGLSQSGVERCYSYVDGSEQITLGWRGPASDARIEEAYRAHYQRLVRILVRITGSRGHAEELASEALCRLSTEENVEAWLFRTAINLGFNALKAQSRRTRHERDAGIEIVRTAQAGDPLDDVLRAERQQHVRNVLAQMKPRDAQLLLLRHEGFSYQETASILKLNPASVGKLLARAMAEFKSKYSKYYGSAL